MSIITQFYNKIKLFFSLNYVELGIAGTVIIVGVTSYFLGRYAYLDTVEKPKIRILDTLDQKTPSSTTTPSIEGVKSQSSNTGVIASKNGKRYYHPWCKGVERISERNKVWFASASDAEKAGLSLGLNCK